MTALEPSLERQAEAEAAKILAELKQLFRSRLVENAAELNAAAALFASTAQPLEEFGPVIRLVHTLTGTAGVFGFPQVGIAAAELEVQLAATIEAKEGRERIVGPLQTLAALCVSEAEEIMPF
jgi:HPt (histidine-containing phosphotransfer) domain-containing protein